MTSEGSTASRLSSPAARVTLVMSALFATTGVVLAFLPRWLEVERGLAGAEIGLVLSLAQMARIVTGPAIAFWADGAADRRTPLRIVALAALASYAAFFFLADDFVSLLIVGFIALSLTQAITPLVEAATLRATAQGAFSYGFARGAGSIAFILANIAGGVLVARFGLGAVVAWVLCGLVVVALTSWTALKPDPPLQRVRSDARVGGLLALLRSRRFMIAIVACGLIQSTHAFYYGFSTLTWRAQGIAPEMVGVLWAFAVVVEVAFLWSLAPVERRFSPEVLVLAGAGAGVVRWALMGLAPEGFALWPLQALHALTFAAAHVGAMRLIYREATDATASMAQTLYAALSGGVLMGLATLLSGFLYDWGGAQGYWAMALIAALGGALALLLLPSRTRAPRSS